MVSTSDFWRLAVESRLLTVQQVERLQSEFAQLKGSSPHGSAAALIEWLVARHVLSRYQTKILGGGRAGPFFYGDYRVYDRLESGPLSGMFRAVHVASNHPVLLQFLTGPVTNDPTRWAAAAAQTARFVGLRHPHLARIHELVDLVTFKFVVLEDLTGRSLQQQLGDAGRYPPAEACRLAWQLAQGLAYLHGQGLVAGDLRASRIWVGDDGHVRLLMDPIRPPEPPQFGGPDAGGELLERADYLAPEFTRPGKLPDALTDIYALGCLTYQMLHGSPPFAGGDLTRKLQRHAKEPIAPLEPLGVPQPIAQIVAYMMAKNPTVRFPRADLVAQQLQPLVDPSRLAQRPDVPSTLAAYDAALQQRYRIQQPAAAVAAPAAVTAPATVTAPAVAFAASPLAVGAGPAIGTPRPAGGGPALQPVGVSASEPSASSALRTSRRSKPNPALLVASLVGGTIVVILVLLILNSGGQQTPPGEREAVASADGSGGGTGPGPADNLAGQGPIATGGQGPRASAEDLAGLRPVATGGQRPGTSGGQRPEGTSGTGGGDEQAVEPDDGQMLWASPTAGRPWRLNYFAPGAQVLCGFRPAAMLQSEPGRQVLEALGPQLASTRSEWEQASGVAWEEVDRMLVGWFDAGEQLPRVCCAVWLPERRSEQELLSSWGNPPATDGGFYQAGGTAYYIPLQADGPSFVMGHPAEIQELASLRGAVPPMARGLERLLASSDDQRDFTLLVVPSYLSSNVLRDGRQYYFGSPAPLRGALEWLLGDDVQAGLVSMHFGPQFYWELRLHSTLSRDYRTLASELRDRIAQVPDAIERHIVSLNPHPYWRLVAFRYPSMVRFLHRHARIGVEDEQAVVNGVLPGEAAHNLVFGGEMVLSAGPGTPVAVAVAGDGPAAAPKSVEEVLKLQMDLMFDQTSLEFAMRDLAADVNETHKLGDAFEIRIIGDDLKLEGITRNQQIRDFAQKGQTVADILTALVRKANPVTTVQDPSEVDQKLIWVVAPDPEKPDRKIVLITTRSAAATKSYTLPEPFRPKQ